MARILYATVLITLLNLLAGCPDPYRPDSRRVPETGREGGFYPPAGASEIDLAEKVQISRQTYQQDLEHLVGYYSRSGNNLKLEWARKELNALRTMPKYKYILGPTPGQEYQATTSVPEADNLYYDARELEREARPMGTGRVLTDKDKLRLALQKYEQLIKNHPSSDKIDDAAFYAGVILEELGDYVVALDYYKSAFEWDAETPYPARFKAAYILDRHLHRYDEALDLYNEALQIEARYDRHRQWKDFAEQRVRELQKLEEGES